MKQKRSINYKNSLFMIVIFIATLLMSIGYATINSISMNIDGNVTAQSQNGIFITDVVHESNINSENSKINSFYQTMMSNEIILSSEDNNSSVTYSVTVYNSTNDNYGFEKVEYDSAFYDNNNITYTLSNIEEGSLLLPKSYMTFNITFHYSNYTLSNNNILNSYINFSFKKLYTVTYVNFSSSNYQDYVLEGNDLQVTFNEYAGSAIKISNGESIIDSSQYTFENKTLLISDVTSNLIITKITRFYETILLSNKISDDCPSVTNDFAIIEAPETGDKFCTLADNYGSSYYFRGASTTNHVLFAGYYWRIIRVNGDNSVRMIYAGDSSEISAPLDNGYNDSTTKYTLIGSGKINTINTDNTYMGYMYGTAGATTYANAHTNKTNSVMKTTFDSWYDSSGLSQYETYLADNLYCNDRTVYNSTIQNTLGMSKISDDTGYGYSSYVTYFGPYYRLIESSSGATKHFVTLQCSKNDSFTVSDTTNGNGRLTKKIGTITADEVILAGGMHKSTATNNSYYLYTGSTYWTMTPSYKTGTNYSGYGSAFSVYTSGWMSGGGPVTDARGYRPVINISSEVLIASGNGTKEKPYELTLE